MRAGLVAVCTVWHYIERARQDTAKKKKKYWVSSSDYSGPTEVSLLIHFIETMSIKSFQFHVWCLKRRFNLYGVIYLTVEIDSAVLK